MCCAHVLCCGVVCRDVMFLDVLYCVMLYCFAMCCAHVVWCDVVFLDMVFLDMLCGMLGCDVVWCGVVWCDVVWCDVVWCDVMLSILQQISTCFSLSQDTAQSRSQTSALAGTRQPVADLTPSENSTKRSPPTSLEFSSPAKTPPAPRNLTPSEQRALDAEKRAAWRQARMKELEEDAMKAQVVIAQVKAMSASSLEGTSVSDDDKKISTPTSQDKFSNSTSRISPGLTRRSWAVGTRNSLFLFRTALFISRYGNASQIWVDGRDGLPEFSSHE